MRTGFDVLDAVSRLSRLHKREDWSPCRDLQHEIHVLTGMPYAKLGTLVATRYNNNMTRVEKRLDELLTCKDSSWTRIDRDWMGEMIMACAFGVPFRPRRAEELGELYAERIREREARLPFKLGSNAAWEKHFKVRLPRSPQGRPLANKNNMSEVIALHPGLEELYTHREDTRLHGYFHPDRASLDSNLWQYQADSPYREGPHLFGDKTLYFGTRTGRLQYQRPAFTNLSKGIARSAIGYDKDAKWKLLGIDVSGLEYRIMAYEMYKRYDDPSIWSEKQAGTCPKEKTRKIFRPLLVNYTEDKHINVCKTINYAKIYGMQMTSMLALLKLADTKDNRDRVAAAIKERFPSLDRLEEDTQAAISNHRIRNLFGMPVSTYSEKGSRDVGLNTYIQSSGSSYCKAVYSAFLKALRRRCPEARLVLFVHDEIQVSVPDSLDAASVEQAIRAAHDDVILKDVNGRDIPILADLDWRFGKTWEDTH